MRIFANVQKLIEYFNTLALYPGFYLIFMNIILNIFMMGLKHKINFNREMDFNF